MTQSNDLFEIVPQVWFSCNALQGKLPKPFFSVFYDVQVGPQNHFSPPQHDFGPRGPGDGAFSEIPYHSSLVCMSGKNVHCKYRLQLCSWQVCLLQSSQRRFK